MLEALMKENGLLNCTSDLENGFKKMHQQVIDFPLTTIDDILGADSVDDLENGTIQSAYLTIKEGEKIVIDYHEHTYTMPKSDIRVGNIEAAISRFAEAVPSIATMYWNAFKNRKPAKNDPSEPIEKNDRHQAKHYAETYLTLLDAADYFGKKVRWSKGKRIEAQGYIAATEESESIEILKTEKEVEAYVSKMNRFKEETEDISLDPSKEEIKYLQKQKSVIADDPFARQKQISYLQSIYSIADDARKGCIDARERKLDSIAASYLTNVEEIGSVAVQIPTLKGLQAFSEKLNEHKSTLWEIRNNSSKLGIDVGGVYATRKLVDDRSDSVELNRKKALALVKLGSEVKSDYNNISLTKKKINELGNLEKRFSRNKNPTEKIEGFSELADKVDKGISELKNAYAEGMRGLAEKAKKGDISMGRVLPLLEVLDSYIPMQTEILEAKGHIEKKKHEKAQREAQNKYKDQLAEVRARYDSLSSTLSETQEQLSKAKDENGKYSRVVKTFKGRVTDLKNVYDSLSEELKAAKLGLKNAKEGTRILEERLGKFQVLEEQVQELRQELSEKSPEIVYITAKDKETPFSFNNYIQEMGNPVIYHFMELRKILTEDKPWIERLAAFDKKVGSLPPSWNKQDVEYGKKMYAGLEEAAKHGDLAQELKVQGRKEVFEKTMDNFKNYLA